MKKILLACSLLAITSSTVMAQNSLSASNTISEAPKFKKINFISKASEIDATISRQRPDLAQNSFSDISAIMVYFIGQNNNLLNDNHSKADKTEVKKTMDLQNKLYSEIKMLSPDIVKNREKLAEKFKEFAATLPE